MSMGSKMHIYLFWEKPAKMPLRVVNETGSFVFAFSRKVARNEIVPKKRYFANSHYICDIFAILNDVTFVSISFAMQDHRESTIFTCSCQKAATLHLQLKYLKFDFENVFSFL